MTQPNSIFISHSKESSRAISKSIPKVIMTIAVLASSLFSQQLFSQALPVEKKIAQIVRRADSGNLITDSLSVNLSKTITVQVPYTERVPYEATETYTIEVPYQDTETYVETVPYQIQVPYTEYITDYRQEQRCNTVTRYRQECHNERQCRTVPGSGQNCRYVEECGTNVHGQRICKTRQVCSSNPPQERCDYRQVCHSVPYTDRECSYVQVPYQREVTRYRTETRYRQETRTRTVTRYRTETRTRTVTRYRDEQRCCRSETQVVFDRQLQYQLELHFPSDAILAPNQTETLNIILVAANEQAAQVQLQQLNTIYNYTIANQSANGSIIRVELAATPKRFLSEQDLASLSDSKKLNIELAGAGIESALLITDSTIEFTDVETQYTIFLDLNTDNGNKPLNARTFTRAQLKESGGLVRMADVILNPAVTQEALVRGNIIVYSVVAKRSGASPLLAGKTVKAQKLSSFVLE